MCLLSPGAGIACGQPSMRQPIDEGTQGCLGTELRLELEWGCGKGLGGGMTMIHELEE